MHFFVRKVAFQRERAYIRCAEIVLSIMLERIQYALFVLLFVLAGSLDGATSQGGACRVQPGMSPQAALHAPVTAQNYFTAAVMLSGDASIEIPAHSSEHKAIVRHRFYARSAAAEAVAQLGALGPRRALFQAGRLLHLFSGADSDLAPAVPFCQPHGFRPRRPVRRGHARFSCSGI